MSKTLKVGMIGYRFMGKAHSNGWRQAPHFFPLKADLEMHTICGRNKEALEASAKELGWNNISTSWEEVINNPEIDIVDTKEQWYWEIELSVFFNMALA